MTVANTTFTGPRVCVVGSINMDLVVRTQKLPTPGETVLGGGYRTFPGGKGANQAVAAARMGALTTLIGMIGDDPHGQKVKAALEAEQAISSLDLTHLIIKPGEPTGLALITVAEGNASGVGAGSAGENTIVVAPGVNAQLDAAHVELHERAILEADVLLVQLEIPNTAVLAAVVAARRAGKAVILNAAPARMLGPELLKNVDVIVVNRPEASKMLGMDANLDPARLALRLPELGPTTAIMTMGSQGAILAHKGRPRRVPAVSVQSVDSVGSGDAFCGALAAMWGPVHAASKARSQEEFALGERAVLAASVAGSLASTRHGAMGSMPMRDEVLKLSQDLRVS
jgi:ribokinase